MSSLLPGFQVVSSQTVQEATDHWLANAIPLPSFEDRSSQSKWDIPLCEARLKALINRSTDEVDLIRLRSISRPNSQAGLWLETLPSRQIGTLMDPAHFTIAAALRLGTRICLPFICACGSTQDPLGLHALSCNTCSAFGRQSRHAAVNDLLVRALNQAGCPSTKEPSHLIRDDGKRVDGATVMPFAFGKCVIWDFTCSDSYAISYRRLNLAKPRGAAKEAERKKSIKYSRVTPEFVFKPVAVESSGIFIFWDGALNFTREIGQRLKAVSGESRSTTFLRQRISVEVQRGNAISILSAVSSGLSRDVY